MSSGRSSFLALLSFSLPFLSFYSAGSLPLRSIQVSVDHSLPLSDPASLSFSTLSAALEHLCSNESYYSQSEIPQNDNTTISIDIAPQLYTQPPYLPSVATDSGFPSSGSARCPLYSLRIRGGNSAGIGGVVQGSNLVSFLPIDTPSAFVGFRVSGVTGGVSVQNLRVSECVRTLSTLSGSLADGGCFSITDVGGEIELSGLDVRQSGLDSLVGQTVRGGFAKLGPAQSVSISNVRCLNCFLKVSSGPPGDSAGGSLYIVASSGKVNISNSEFNGGSSPYNTAGVVIDPTPTDGRAQVLVRDCTFANLDNVNFAAALWIKSSCGLDSFVRVDDTSFVNCSSRGRPCGTSGPCATAMVAASVPDTCSSPTLTSLNISNCAFENNTAEDSAAIFTWGKLFVRSTSFVGNRARQHAGVQFMGGCCRNNAPPIYSYENCTFDGNTAKLSGGAFWANWYDCASAPCTLGTIPRLPTQLSLVDCSFANHASNGSAVFRVSLDSLLVDSCEFIDNRGDGSRPAVFVSNVRTASLTSTSFRGNSKASGLGATALGCTGGGVVDLSCIQMSQNGFPDSGTTSSADCSSCSWIGDTVCVPSGCVGGRDLCGRCTDGLNNGSAVIDACLDRCGVCKGDNSSCATTGLLVSPSSGSAAGTTTAGSVSAPSGTEAGGESSVILIFALIVIAVVVALAATTISVVLLARRRRKGHGSSSNGGSVEGSESESPDSEPRVSSGDGKEEGQEDGVYQNVKQGGSPIIYNNLDAVDDDDTNGASSAYQNVESARNNKNDSPPIYNALGEVDDDVPESPIYNTATYVRETS
jgi:hypothetical protein